jgi:actin-like ATPase involved in cell morphogenesis
MVVDIGRDRTEGAVLSGLPVSVAEDPLLCVALGTGHAVENSGRPRGIRSLMYQQ